mmetsp:Transcript_3977/g.16599  ORF Transcript_3977/g.16599 Transcript_3977/m.16599 type:complete len:224 (+) Transcript_3977:182-853(+)
MTTVRTRARATTRATTTRTTTQTKQTKRTKTKTTRRTRKRWQRAPHAAALTSLKPRTATTTAVAPACRPGRPGQLVGATRKRAAGSASPGTTTPRTMTTAAATTARTAGGRWQQRRGRRPRRQGQPRAPVAGRWPPRPEPGGRLLRGALRSPGLRRGCVVASGLCGGGAGSGSARSRSGCCAFAGGSARPLPRRVRDAGSLRRRATWRIGGCQLRPRFGPWWS